MSSIEVEVMTAAVAANVPVLLWGDPGIGKSSLVDATFEDVTTLVGNVRLPEDFGGIPWVNNGRMELAAPSWALDANERSKDGKIVVLFLDELSTCTPAVQASMLRIVQERYAGDLRLNDGVRVIAAANPPENAAHGWGLAAPLANRFCHVDIGVNRERWIDAMVSGWPRESYHTPRYTPGWHAKIAGFIQHRPVALGPSVPKDLGEASKAWPSPRSWDLAARIAAYCNSESAKMLAFAGCVGRPIQAEFWNWLGTADLPDPQRVLEDPRMIDWRDCRPDRRFAILAGVIGYCSEHLDQQTWDKAWQCLAYCANSASVDMAVHAADQLLRLPDTDHFDTPFEALMAFKDLFKMARGH